MAGEFKAMMKCDGCQASRLCKQRFSQARNIETTAAFEAQGAKAKPRNRYLDFFIALYYDVRLPLQESSTVSPDVFSLNTRKKPGYRDLPLYSAMLPRTI